MKLSEFLLFVTIVGGLGPGFATSAAGGEPRELPSSLRPSPELGFELCAFRTSVLRVMLLQPKDSKTYKSILGAADERIRIYMRDILPHDSAAVTVGQFCAQTALVSTTLSTGPSDQSIARRRAIDGGITLGLGVTGLASGAGVALKCNVCASPVLPAVLWAMGSAISLAGATLLGIGVQDLRRFRTVPKIRLMARRQLIGGGIALGLGAMAIASGVALTSRCSRTSYSDIVDPCLANFYTIPIWTIGEALIVGGAMSLAFGARDLKRLRRASLSLGPGPRLVGISLQASF